MTQPAVVGWRPSKPHSFTEKMWCRDCGFSAQGIMETKRPCTIFPYPLRRNPVVSETQWDWIDYQINVAARQLQQENTTRFHSHLTQMRWLWLMQDLYGERHATVSR